MSVIITICMVMTPLMGYPDLVRADGGTVDKIWAVPGEDGPDISTITISDDQPGEEYVLFGLFIDDYVNYEITPEDDGLMILANNSSLETPPGLNIDYRLSGECYVTVTGLMVAFTDDRFPEYEGDKSVPSLLEFYTSDTYEDDEENGHWAERLNIEVFGEMDITDWFAANDLIIDEGAVFNIGYYDGENDEWHDGHVTAGNVIIGGEIYIGDRNADGIESELIVFDDLSVYSGGQLLAACNARLVFDDMATCSIDGFPFKVNDGNGGFEDFEFEDGHGVYEFIARPVDLEDPDSGIFWEYIKHDPVIVKYWLRDGTDPADGDYLFCDEQPEGYSLFAKYMNNCRDYVTSEEDDGITLFANNSNIISDPSIQFSDFRLSGDSSLEYTGMAIISTDGRFHTYTGSDFDPDEVGAFYFSPDYEYQMYEDGSESWALSYNYEITGSFDCDFDIIAENLIIDEGVVLNIVSSFDGENEEFHNGFVLGRHILINGEIHLDDDHDIDPNDMNRGAELVVDWDGDISLGENGLLTYACNANLVIEPRAVYNFEGLPLFFRNDENELVPFEFDTDHDYRYEFYSVPGEDDETVWEYREPGPDQRDYTFFVDYDERDNAGVTIGADEGETKLRPWDMYDYEPGSPVVFTLYPPEGIDVSTAIVEIHEYGEEEDICYRSDLDPSDEHYIYIDRESGMFDFTTDCKGFEVFVSWSAYEFRFDRDTHFVVELHSNDRGSIVFADDSACERVEEDPYNPGHFRYLFNKDVFDDGNVLQITFVPDKGCILQDFGTNLNEVETFYGREERPDHLTILFDDEENLINNGDGTYTWTISDSPEWYNVFAYFEKIVNVDGIEIGAHDATVEYKLDNGSFVTLPVSTIGFGDGAREGYVISPETLEGHDSITFRFTYEDGVVKEGIRVEYSEGTDRKIDMLPFDNDSNPYEFTLNKTGSEWNDYYIEVNDWMTPFNGTYLVSKHGPGDVTVTGIESDVMTSYEQGETLTFTVTCNEGIYKVYGRYSNDPANMEFEIYCENGTYTVTPNGGGLDIMIYTTQEEYNIDHLNANYGNGEFDFEIFVHEHGFHENDAQFDGEFTFVEDPHIKAFAASGNRTRFVVAYTDTELLEGKAKITLNLIPKYDCVYEVHVGGNEIEIVDGQAEVDLSDVISGARHPINIDVTYEEPKTITLADTEHVAVSYSLDGDSFTAFPEENILDLKSFPDIYEIYIKTEAEEGYVCDSIDIYVNGECIETRSEMKGVYRFDVNDEWVCCEIRPQFNRTGGNYTVKYAREEDSSELIFNGITANSPVSYYSGDEIVIDTLLGDVYKAYAITDGLEPIELTKDGRLYRFTPPQNGDYDIIFYISYDEYVFETLQGDHFARINVVGLTEEAGAITCADSTGSATYQGVMKFACPNDTTEISIQVNEGYDYTIVNDQQEDITTMAKNNGNKLNLACDAGSWQTITFVELPKLVSTTTELTFTTEAGTEITMEVLLADTGAVVSSYAWAESTDDGESYTPIVGAMEASLKVSPVVTTLYKCTVTDTYGMSIDVIFTANITVIPLVDNTPDSDKAVTINKFDEAELTARVNENEVAVSSYVWSASTDNGETYEVLSETTKTLKVTPLTDTLYKCVVTGISGQTLEIDFTVTVVVPELLDTREDSEKEFEVEYTDSVTLEAKTNAVEPQYVWSEVSDEGTAMEIPGASGDTFTFTPSSGKVIRCTVTDKFGNSIDLDFGVTVEYVLTDNTQEEDKAVEIVMFESATLAPDIDSSKTTGVTYAWSYLEDGTEFTALPDTDPSIMVTPESFTTYKCIVSDEHGNEVTVIFTVNVTVPELNDTRDESDKMITVDYDGTTEVTLDAKTDGTAEYQFSYTWSESVDGLNFTPIAGASGKTFSFIPSDYTTIRCTVTDIYGHGLELDFVVSVRFGLTDNTPESSKDVTILKSESATLEPDIDESNTNGVTYVWYESTDGTVYSDYPDATTKSYEVTPDETTYYKCIVSDVHGNSITIFYRVTVIASEMKDERLDSEKSVEVVYSGSVTLEAKTDGIEPSCYWSSSADGTEFTPILGATGESFTYNPYASEIIRCSVTDKFGRTIDLYFDVTVNYELTDNTPASAKEVTITKFEAVTLEPSIDSSKTTDVTYTWSTSEDGTNYTEKANSSSVTGAPLKTTYYKCVVSDSHGNSVTVIFKVNVKVPVLKDLTSAASKKVTAEKGKSITLEAKVNESDTKEVKYAWSKSTDGSTYSAVSGQTSAKLKVNVEENATYKCKVTDLYGNEVEIVFTVTATDPVTPEPTPDESGTFEGFVERLYNVALGRPSEEEGKKYWVDNVSAGNLTGADCARSFLCSPEFLSKNMTDEEFVGILYETFFDRNYKDDPEGTQFWLDSLQVVGKDSVIDSFINSTEWCNICASFGIRSGATRAKATEPSANALAFAERLYTCCLGREAEQEGLMFWSLALTNQETSGSDAARLFFESPEFVGFGLDDENYIRRLYTTFMGREADDEGLKYWLDCMSHGATRNDIFNSFVNSREFSEICKSYGIKK